MNKLKYSLFFVFPLAFMACDDDDEVVDVTPPTITMNEPVSGEAIQADGTIHFDALFEDDVKLATYNIDIHNNFDGHSHGRLDLAAFEYEESFSLTGKMDDVHEDIQVSTDAIAGPYHLTVEAIDAAGNSTTFADGSSVESEIWITNTTMAIVHFHDDSENEIDEYEGTVDTPLEFYGEIEDQEGKFHHIDIIVGHFEGAGDHDHDHDHEGGRLSDEDAIYEKEFEMEATEAKIEDLLDGESIVVSQSDLSDLEEGEHLHLIIRVEDESGNISRHAIEIHFD